MIRLIYIVRCIVSTVLLSLLLALAPAMAQNVVYTGETTQLGVKPMPGDTYVWELYLDATVDFALVPGDCPASDADFIGTNTSSTVSVQWKKPGIYFFKVTARDASGCTNNLKIGMMKVIDALPTAIITPPNPICVGETASLEVTFTGTGPWDFTYTDGTNLRTITGITENKYLLMINPGKSTSYWITEVKDQTGTNIVPSPAVLLQVNPKPASSKIYLYEP